MEREPYDNDAVEIGLLVGHATVLDPLEPTEDEWEEHREQLRKRLARKVRLGFRREPLP